MKLSIGEKLTNIIITVIVICHIALLLQLIFFPYPELFIYSYLTGKGLLPYKEIIDQHFPGLMFLPVNFQSLGIDTLEKMRLVHLTLIVIGDLIFVNIAKKILKTNLFVVISLILYIFWQTFFEGHVLWIESFITPLLLLSFYFLLKINRSGIYTQLIPVGVGLGLAFLFKQTVLPLAVLIFLYLFFIKVPFRKMVVLLTIFLLPITLAVLHFINIGVFKDFVYWTFTFNLTTFNEMGKTHPGLKDLIKLLPTLGVSIAGICHFLSRKEGKNIALPAIFLLGTLFFAYARYDLIHLQPALPYMILLAIITLENLNAKKWIMPLMAAYCAFSLYVFVPSFHFYNKPGISPMFNDKETLSLIQNLQKYEKDSSKVFAMGTYPHIYYLTGTIPPGRIFSFQFPWFMKIAQNRVLDGIISDQPDIIIRDAQARVGGYVLGDYMQDIDRYINENYRKAENAENIEVLVKI